MTLRMALGDFVFDASTYLDTENNQLWWFCWLLIVAITCVVFLNFVIAEASASYEKINQRIGTYIAKQKVDMIREAEEMTISCY